METGTGDEASAYTSSLPHTSFTAFSKSFARLDGEGSTRIHAVLLLKCWQEVLSPRELLRIMLVMKT